VTSPFLCHMCCCYCCCYCCCVCVSSIALLNGSGVCLSVSLVAQFVFVTMATLGYGDITPVTAAETLMNLFLMVIGTSVFGYVIACISQLVTTGGHTLSARAENKIKEINAYLVPWTCLLCQRGSFSFYRSLCFLWRDVVVTVVCPVTLVDRGSKRCRSP
jgi:hypothetical protein